MYDTKVLMDHRGFVLPPLLYPYDALSPYINAETLQMHHQGYLGASVEILNASLYRYPYYFNYSIEQLIRGAQNFPGEIALPVFRSAGSIYNHNFYFDMMNPHSVGSRPEGDLMKAIEFAYGNFDQFEEALYQKAMVAYGGGWVWLVVNQQGIVELITTEDESTPILLDVYPLICIDVWEHAYMAQYQLRKSEYIRGWFHLVDWNKAKIHYMAAIQELGLVEEKRREEQE